MRISVEGAEPESAALVVVMLHGGGSSALDFLGLSQQFGDDDSICWLAPQAMNPSWYPGQTVDSRAGKEPYFTVSVLSVLGLLEQHAERPLALIGFGDGAGIVSELLTKPELPRSVRAAWIASGGMVGLEDEWPERPKLSLSVLVSGCEDDPQLAGDRLAQTERYFQQTGASVKRRFYEGASPHIEAQEMALAQTLIREAKR